MDDFGFGGGFDDAPADTFGGGDSFAPSPKAPRRKASARAGIYAKSREQKMMEQAEDLEYQQMLNDERERQDKLQNGFGNADDDDGMDAFGGGNSPPAEQSFGFKCTVCSHRANAPCMDTLWGSANSAQNNVVIPPFVPREQRNKRAWDVGKMKKSVADKHILAGKTGEFLIRETAKGDRHVVGVNDQGSLYEAYIRHVGDGFVFMSREFSNLADIVTHLQRNPLYNKQGLPLYIENPVKVT